MWYLVKPLLGVQTVFLHVFFLFFFLNILFPSLILFAFPQNINPFFPFIKAIKFLYFWVCFELTFGAAVDMLIFPGCCYSTETCRGKYIICKRWGSSIYQKVHCNTKHKRNSARLTITHGIARYYSKPLSQWWQKKIDKSTASAAIGLWIQSKGSKT